MLKNAKKLFLGLTSVTVLSISLTSCGKPQTPADPHKAVSLAFENTFNGISGYNELSEKYGATEFIEAAYNSGAITDLDLMLTNIEGTGKYDTIIKSMSPEIKFSSAYTVKDFAAKLDLGVIIEALNLNNLNGSIYIDADEAVFGLPDTSKMYSVDLQSILGPQYDAYKATFNSYSEYMPAILKLSKNLPDHFSNDYDEAWELCEVEKTDTGKAFVLSDGNKIKCNEYTVNITPEAIKSAADIFINYLKTNDDIKNVIINNPALLSSLTFSDKTSDDMYDEFISGIEEGYAEFEENFNMDNSFPITIYTYENKIRSISFMVESEESNVAVNIETLGVTYPFDDTNITIENNDEEIATITFKADDSKKLNYNLAISSPSLGGEIVNLDYALDKDSNDASSNVTINSPDGVITLDCQTNSTVDEKGKAFSTDIKELNASAEISGQKYAIGLTGNCSVKIIDEIDVPDFDETISTQEDLMNAFTEIQNSLDLSSLTSLFQ